jgi:hypothetical protein
METMMKNMKDIKRTLAGLTAASLLTVAMTVGGTAVGTDAIEAATTTACHSTSYIPTLNPMTLQHVSGATVSLLRDNYNYQPTVHVWLNSAYAGEFFVPLDLAEGEIQVKFGTEQRYQTGLDGKVRLVLQTVTYVEVCGEWYGGLP